MKKYFICIICVFAVFVIILYLRLSQKEQNLQTNKQYPFSVHLENAEIVEDTVEGRSERRLLLEVSIENESTENFPDTEYVLRLNGEVQPYIASQILEWQIEKKDIYSREECFASDEEGTLIYGFNHSWNTLLTTEDDLKTSYDLEPSGICTALKHLEVEIYWDGGGQREILEIELKDTE